MYKKEIFTYGWSVETSKKTHTSSKTAAPAKTVPSLVFSRGPTLIVVAPPTALRTTKVVPRDVELMDAPAAKDSSEPYSPMGKRRKLRPMGTPIPKRAIVVARGRERMSVLSEVVMPPEG